MNNLRIARKHSSQFLTAHAIAKALSSKLPHDASYKNTPDEKGSLVLIVYWE